LKSCAERLKSSDVGAKRRCRSNPPARFRYALRLLFFAAGKLFISARRASRNASIGKGFALRLLPIARKKFIAGALRRFQIPAQLTNSDASPTTDLPGGPGRRHFEPFARLGRRPDFQSRPDRVTCSFAMRHFHEPAGSNDFNNPGEWNKASYTPDLLAELGEPLPDPVNGYRQAALYHLQLMYAVDEFLTAAEDSRLAVVAVAVVFGWPSARGLTLGNIADQLGCSLSTLTRSIARFKTIAGLGFLPPAAFGPVPGHRTATSRRRFKA
jgi:hypothetical protein